MVRVRRARLALAVLVAALCGSSGAHERGPELLDRLPNDVVGAFSVDNAAALRQGEVGLAITRWMVEQDAMAQTRRAWGLFARRLGVGEVEAFDELLGGRAVLAFGRRDAQAPLDWIVLAAVEGAMDVRLVRRTRAVPRKIVYGRALLGLEEESFLLATLPPLNDGRSVLAFAPAGAEWLLARTLAVSAGRAEVLPGDMLRHAPADAVVRGFWRHQPTDGPGIVGDLERWMSNPREPTRTLALWATAKGGTVEINLSPTAGEAAPEPNPSEAAPGVLLDITGPGQAIVAGVLDRAGLIGLVPEGLTLTKGTGELVVRRGPEGVDLGARLPVAPPDAQSLSHSGQPAASLGQVRVRELSDTPASRAIFGPAPRMAWTVLEGGPDQLGKAELVVAVTAGPGEAAPAANPGINGDSPEAQAVDIVIEAVARPSPTTLGVHGSARPHELWSLLRSTAQPTEPGAKPGGKSGEAGGFASVASLIDRARWAVEAAPGAVRGRIVLELREAARK